MLANAAAMDFCVGCGSDLLNSKKYVRNLSFPSSAFSCTVNLGVASTWLDLMKEAVESQCYNRVFTDENACLRMCKNCFKVFENLSKKIVSVKEKVSKAASRACRSVSSQGHSSNPSDYYFQQISHFLYRLLFINL